MVEPKDLAGGFPRCWDRCEAKYAVKAKEPGVFKVGDEVWTKEDADGFPGEHGKIYDNDGDPEENHPWRVRFSSGITHCYSAKELEHG